VGSPENRVIVARPVIRSGRGRVVRFKSRGLGGVAGALFEEVLGHLVERDRR
jgi:hypothetical protein